MKRLNQMLIEVAGALGVDYHPGQAYDHPLGTIPFGGEVTAIITGIKTIISLDNHDADASDGLIVIRMELRAHRAASQPAARRELIAHLSHDRRVQRVWWNQETLAVALRANRALSSLVVLDLLEEVCEAVDLRR